MESNPTTDDASKKESTETPKPPPVPLANLLDVKAFGQERGLGAFTEKVEPPKDIISPVVRVERPEVHTPEEPAEQPPPAEHPMYAADASEAFRQQAEKEKEEEEDEDDSSSSPPPRPWIIHDTKEEPPVEYTPLMPVEHQTEAAPSESEEAPEAPTTMHLTREAFSLPPVEHIETPPPPPDKAEPETVWHRSMQYEPMEREPEPVAHHNHDIQPHTHTEIHELRRNAAADLLLVALGGWYLNRKINRHHKEEVKALKKLERGQAEQTEQAYHTQQRINQQNRTLEQLGYAQRHPEQEKPAPGPAEIEYLRQRALAAEQVAAEQANKGQDPGYHIEHAWYDELVDRNGQAVAGAKEHGRAFHEERQAEQAGYRFARYNPHQQQQGGVVYDAYGNPIQPGTPPPAPFDPRHMLEDGRIAPDHLLEKGNPLKNAVTNPWIWVGLAILIFAFFSAAFIA